MDDDLARLKRIEAAAKALVENSPIGDDDKPYASEIVGKEFDALVKALAS